MSNDVTLDEFFTILNDSLSAASYHNVSQLMSQVFCAENPQKTIPAVGITDHGPQFIGKDSVAELFGQLFKTFPDMELTPVRGAPRLYSQGDPKTIGIQTTLAGAHQEEWFPRGHKNYSPPLSGIHPDKHHVMKIPACAVFTFDDSGKVTRLAIYLDRYRMMRQLTPAP